MKHLPIPSACLRARLELQRPGCVKRLAGKRTQMAAWPVIARQNQRVQYRLGGARFPRLAGTGLRVEVIRLYLIPQGNPLLHMLKDGIFRGGLSPLMQERAELGPGQGIRQNRMAGHAYRIVVAL